MSIVSENFGRYQKNVRVIWYSFQFCVLGCSDPLGVRDLRALRPFVVMWYSDQFSDDRCSDTQCIKEEEIC